MLQSFFDSKIEANNLVNPAVPSGYHGCHLFVMVHGFQGNSYDMRLLKNNLSLLNPDALFLCSTMNEDKTEGDIMELGLNLASEVTSYINEWCPGTSLGRFSHSLT